jgi:hypothetical protein
MTRSQPVRSGVVLALPVFGGGMRADDPEDRAAEAVVRLGGKVTVT